MSNIGTVPPWEFTQEGSFAAPYTVPIPASLEVQPYTATATFDGTGAGGNFVPTITIIGPGGEKLARVQPQSIVTAGNTASCTWLPPFGSAASSSGAIEVTDGTTTVKPTTEIDFVGGAQVTNLGGGIAGVLIVGPQAFIGARIFNTAIQTIAQTTNTDCVYDSIDSNVGMTINLVANARIMTAIVAGYYLVSMNIDYAPDANGRRIAIFYKNGYYSIPSGTELGGYATAGLAGTGVTTPVGVAQVVFLAAGDFISSGTYQDSGGDLDTSPGGEQNFFAAALIGS